MKQATLDPGSRRNILQQTFQEVRHIFFPTWDRNREWKSRILHNMPRGGWYDDERKCIWLSHIPESKVKFEGILIHEICHSTSLCHGAPWQRRMTQAAKRAARLQRLDLAGFLLEEIGAYKRETEEAPWTVNNIYTDIKDCIWEHPQWTYRQVLSAVARINGLFLKEMRRYKRCKRVFLEEHRLISVMPARRALTT